MGYLKPFWQLAKSWAGQKDNRNIKLHKSTRRTSSVFFFRVNVISYRITNFEKYMHTKFLMKLYFFPYESYCDNSVVTICKLFQAYINYENLPIKLKLSNIAHKYVSFIIFNFTPILPASV